MTRFIKNWILRFFKPEYHLPLRYYWRKINGNLDAEMLIVDRLLDSANLFIDIGTNIGIYSYHFRNKFAFIEAFEPIDEVTNSLESIKLSNVRVNHVALSSNQGDLELRVPVEKGEPVYTRATLEKKCVNSYVSRQIIVKTLDQYSFEYVDLIKIDVEGHELDVIAGARETIMKWKPILIVEIEKRHLGHDMEAVFSSIMLLGYEGFFITNNRLRSIINFSYTKYQEPYIETPKAREYINNFISIPCRRKI